MRIVLNTLIRLDGENADERQRFSLSIARRRFHAKKLQLCLELLKERRTKEPLVFRAHQDQWI